MKTKIDGIGIDGVDHSIEKKTLSKRAKLGVLSVVNRRCKYCHHHKAFNLNGSFKCTRCKKKGD